MWPLWLASFTQHIVFEVHPCCSGCQYFLLLYALKIFRHMAIALFVYPFILDPSCILKKMLHFCIKSVGGRERKTERQKDREGTLDGAGAWKDSCPHRELGHM